MSTKIEMTKEQTLAARLTMGNEMEQSKYRGDRCWHRAWAMVTTIEHLFCGADYLWASKYVNDYAQAFERFDTEDD